jgi:hypothetical protein
VPVSLEEAHRLLFERTAADSGRFYGPLNAELSLGAGLIYSGIRYPRYDSAREIFVTMTGIVLVLTHECDIDPANERLFNRDVLVLPMVPFQEFYEELSANRDEPSIKGYLGDLAERRIQQLIYLPELPPALRYGALVYMNRIANTDVGVFKRDGVDCLGALTGYGLQQIDQRLQNHFLREKVDPLPLSRIR